MTDLDGLKASFEHKLEQRRAQHQSRLKEGLQELRAHLLKSAGTALSVDVPHLTAAESELPVISADKSAPQDTLPPRQARLDIGASAGLREVDTLFAGTFQLERFYSPYKLGYPTVYCETLEEFFMPMVAQMDLSIQARQAVLQRYVESAREQAERTNGGGIFGYDLPGEGCYLNGWLFVYGKELHPREAFAKPDLLGELLETTIHEKLGHGFIGVYSALGAVKTSLGLYQADVARRFEFRAADDPLSRLRSEQADILFLFSQLLEEGWATWIETFLGHTVFETGVHPRYDLPAVIKAIENMPLDIPDRQQVQGALLGALLVLFGKDDIPLTVIHQAVMTIDVLGREYDDYFSAVLGQTLRYVVGEILLTQAGMNLGPMCVPYAVLIAANVAFDPKAISLADLRELFGRDPRLNPDARLAALSRLKLEQRNSIRELVGRTKAQLSFSVPQELR